MAEPHPTDTESDREREQIPLYPGAWIFKQFSTGRWGKIGGLLVLAVVITIVGLSIYFSAQESNKQQQGKDGLAFIDAMKKLIDQRPHVSPKLGESTILAYDNPLSSDDFPICTDRETMEAVFHSVQVNDDYAYSELVRDGKIFHIKQSIEVRIIADARLYFQIRVLTGSEAGRSGWIPAPWAWRG